MLEEYESEEEGGVGSSNSKGKATKFSVNSLSDEEEGESEEEEVKLKVYFCSRTHSQLSHFIKELRKTVFANEMNAVSSGSRKNFCINEGRSIRHINDYAAILLVDILCASDSSKRSFSHPINNLPQWIKDRLVSATNNYGEVHKLLHQFFRFNKKRGCK